MVIYGDQHPFTLAANINYASDLAACGELAEAIGIGQETLANCRSTLGPDHPDTLMAAVNLAIDVEASGRSGTSGAAPRRGAAPVRGDADHGASRGPSRSAGNQAHCGDRAVLSPARSLITRCLTWVIRRIRSLQ